MFPLSTHHKIIELVNDTEKFTSFMNTATIDLNDTTENIYLLVQQTMRELMNEGRMDQLLNDQQALYLAFEKNFFRIINTENPDENSLLGDIIWWANLTDAIFKNGEVFFGRGSKDGLWLLTTKLQSEWLPNYLKTV